MARTNSSRLCCLPAPRYSTTFTMAVTELVSVRETPCKRDRVSSERCAEWNQHADPGVRVAIDLHDLRQMPQTAPGATPHRNSSIETVPGKVQHWSKYPVVLQLTA
jgi:hypothetical protein